MVPVPAPVEGVTIALDPARGTWRIEAEGETPRTLRVWRWGERRRLVEAAARTGRFDGAAFASSVAATLYDPPPPAALTPLYAYLALDLLGLGRHAAPEPIAAQEARLAARFGWLPSAIAEEPAPPLDALLAAEASPAPDGWSSIRIVGGEDG
jgi:hypothetical protein